MLTSILQENVSGGTIKFHSSEVLTMATKEGIKGFGPLFIRLALGGIFFGHGAQKLFSWFGGRGIEGYATFFEQIGLAPGKFFVLLSGSAEFLGGVFVFLGIFTRLGASMLASSMIVAIAFVHWPKFFGESEYPIALFAMAISIIFTGPGYLAIGGLFKHKA